MEYRIVIKEAQRRLIMRALTNALADDRRSTDGFSSRPEEWMQLIRLFRKRLSMSRSLPDSLLRASTAKRRGSTSARRSSVSVTVALRGNHRAASGSMKALSASSVDGSIITLLHRPSPWSMMISFCVPGF
jgi:hypothetical protein